MGFCSWRTSDTNQSIPNEHSNRPNLPVKLLDDTDNAIIAHSYDGYGRFDGVDFYALTDTMNGGEGDRDSGLRFAFEMKKRADGEPVVLPKIVTLNCEKSYSELPDSPSCEYQGYFYDF